MTRTSKKTAVVERLVVEHQTDLLAMAQFTAAAVVLRGRGRERLRENRSDRLAEQAQADQPPIVITQQIDSTVPAEQLEAAGTAQNPPDATKYGSNDMTVWVHESYGREPNG